MSAQIPALQIIATHYDSYWHRQHFVKADDASRHYCTVEESRGEFKLYSFAGEPSCPLRARHRYC